MKMKTIGIRFLALLATLTIAGCQGPTPQPKPVLSDQALAAANRFRAGTMTRDDAHVIADEFVRFHLTRPKVIELLGSTSGGGHSSLAYTVQPHPQVVVLSLEIKDGVVTAGKVLDLSAPLRGIYPNKDLKATGEPAP